MPQTSPTTALKERVGAIAAAGPQAADGPTILDMVRRQEDAIRRALPGLISAERFTRIVVTQLRTNPSLMACSPESVLGAMMQSAQLGLEFGPLGLSYMVPYKKECQLIIGYKGYCELARRSGDIKDIVARPVYENDEFDYWEDETGDHMIHRRPKPGRPRGELLCFYGRAVYTNGGCLIQVMDLDEIAKRRKRSASAASEYSPWNTDFEAMAAKTCIRAMVPWLPLTTEVAQGIANDEHVVRLRGDDLVAQRPDEEGGGDQLVALPASTSAPAPAEGSEPPPGDADAPPPPPTADDALGGAQGVPEKDALAQDTITKVNAWTKADLDRVVRDLALEAVTGRESEKVLRAKVGMLLAQRRVAGDPAVEALF